MKRLLALLALAPTAALAHPGDHHGVGPWHLLTEPDHLAMIAAVVAVLGYAVWKIWSRQ